MNKHGLNLENNQGLKID